MISRFLEFLFSLQHVRITPNTRFDFVWHYPGLIAPGAIVLAALGYASYLRQAASPNKKRVMGMVRAALLIVVFLLIWRPELIMEHEERTRSVVAVWVDTSRSMQLEDPFTSEKANPLVRGWLKRAAEQADAATMPSQSRPNRFQLSTATLGDSSWLKDLIDTQDVMFFTGGSHAQPLGVAHSRDQVDALVAALKHQRPDADTTDVPAVVREILDKVQGQRVSAVVLLTDGQTTEKGSRLDQAAGIAQQANAKVFGIPVGQENEPFDIKIGPPHLPASTFVKDPVSARLHISGTGITQATPVRINIYRKPAEGGTLGMPLATKEVTLEAGKKELDTEVPLKLEKKAAGKGERFDLVFHIEPVASGAEELYTQNNQATANVTVLDAQINVLYVEGSPRWEYRYLKNELVREPTVNVSTLLLSADPDFTQDADPPVHDKATGEETFPGSIRHFPENAQDLNRYDVILLGDVEPTYFSPTQQRLIVDWVKTRGGGFCWMAGPNYNPESYLGTDMEVLLPVMPDEMDPRARIMMASDNTPFNLVITPAGRDTNLFRFFEDVELSWKQVSDLPQMYWYKPVQGLKPGAIVLAVHPTRSTGGNPAPLLVMRQFGAGPVVFAAYSDTWRWRRYTGEPLFQSYWLQLCRLLYANKALGQSKRLELVAESTRIEVGTPIKISLNVKDPTLAGQLPGEVPILLVDKNGQTVETITLTRSASTATGDIERMEGSATAIRTGEFSLAVRPGSLPVEVPGSDLVVEEPQREFETVTTDMASLKSLSTRTTGEIVHPWETAKLPKKIPDRSIPVLVAQSEELWNKPFALILVVLLAAAEWWIRKSAGLI